MPLICPAFFARGFSCGKNVCFSATTRRGDHSEQSSGIGLTNQAIAIFTSSHRERAVRGDFLDFRKRDIVSSDMFFIPAVPSQPKDVRHRLLFLAYDIVIHVC